MPKKTSSEQDLGPGVTLPPPLFILLIIALAAIIDTFIWPLTLNAFNTPLGIVFAVTATLISAIASISFHHFKTSILPFKADQNLMTSGIFTFSRNPIYLSFLLYQCSFAFLFHNLWGLLLLPASYIFLHFHVIAREERYLVRLFGDEYRQYLKKVRRWL